MIGYTFGAAGLLLAALSIAMIVAVLVQPNHQSNAAKYGAVTIACTFAVAAVVMFIIGQAWLWDHQ